jgi:hypothetical protein
VSLRGRSRTAEDFFRPRRYRWWPQSPGPRGTRAGAERGASEPAAGTTRGASEPATAATRLGGDYGRESGRLCRCLGRPAAVPLVASLGRRRGEPVPPLLVASPGHRRGEPAAMLRGEPPSLLPLPRGRDGDNGREREVAPPHGSSGSVDA